MKRHRGFTLVEMAVVVVIASILLTLGVKGVAAMLAGTQRTATLDNMNTVRNALLAYFTANHRFPCPDTGPAAGRDGVEDRTAVAADPFSGACIQGASPGVGIGTVPYITLGLTRAQALDGYGNFITYRVDTALKVPIYNALAVPLINYSLGDMAAAAINGTVYRSLMNNNTGNSPSSTTLPIPTYAATNTYKMGDLVLDATIPAVYRSLTDNNSNNALITTTSWAVASAPFRTPTTPPAPPVIYSIGDIVVNGAQFYRSKINNINTVFNVANWAQATGATANYFWGSLPNGSGHSWVRTTTVPTGIQYNCGKNIGGALNVFSSPTTNETSTAVVVLISHGANGLGAWVPGGSATTRNALPTIQPEQDNAALIQTLGYRDFPPSNITAAPNDDIVTFIDSTPGVNEATGAIKTYASSLGRPDICH